MKPLPPLDSSFIRRPGAQPLVSKKIFYVPDPAFHEFWEAIGITVSKYLMPKMPMRHELHIDPLFGYFGFRFHPVTHTPESYHLGIDLITYPKTPLYPILPGILEYAGFSLQNGMYVLLAHPEVQTEDGFMLYSAIMHMREPLVSFTAYEKMLREISLHTYPQKKILDDTTIGRAGIHPDDSILHTHIHLQTEFRHRDGRIIACDPLLFFPTYSRQDNYSASCKNEHDFQVLRTSHHDLIKEYHLDSYWDAASSEV